MKLNDFYCEQWMTAYEKEAVYNMTDTSFSALSFHDLFDSKSLEEFDPLLDYGEITGDRGLKKEIERLYTTNDRALTFCHGALEGNEHVMSTLLEPGDHVIAFRPGYQQFYEYPRSLGCTDMEQGNQSVPAGSLLSFVLYVFFLCPRIKSALNFHLGNAGIYLLPCRMVRIIIGSLQSPVYLRLRLRLLLMPAHARLVGQYLVAVPVIHMDGRTRPLGLELGFKSPFHNESSICHLTIVFFHNADTI